MSRQPGKHIARNRVPRPDVNPRMLPQLRATATGDEAQWRAHQQNMWQEYQDQDEGVFSRDDHELARVEWIGIDPFFGVARRQFPFAEALAEYPRFGPETFDGALYVSTLYHVLEPVLAENTHPLRDQPVGPNNPSRGSFGENPWQAPPV